MVLKQPEPMSMPRTCYHQRLGGCPSSRLLPGNTLMLKSYTEMAGLLTVCTTRESGLCTSPGQHGRASPGGRGRSRKHSLTGLRVRELESWSHTLTGQNCRAGPGWHRHRNAERLINSATTQFQIQGLSWLTPIFTPPINCWSL